MKNSWTVNRSTVQLFFNRVFRSSFELTVENEIKLLILGETQSSTTFVLNTAMLMSTQKKLHEITVNTSVVIPLPYDCMGDAEDGLRNSVQQDMLCLIL